MSDSSSPATDAAAAPAPAPAPAPDRRRAPHWITIDEAYVRSMVRQHGGTRDGVVTALEVSIQRALGLEDGQVSCAWDASVEAWIALVERPGGWTRYQLPPRVGQWIRAKCAGHVHFALRPERAERLDLAGGGGSAAAAAAAAAAALAPAAAAAPAKGKAKRIVRSHKIALDPTLKQGQYLEAHAEFARLAYNWARYRWREGTHEPVEVEARPATPGGPARTKVVWRWKPKEEQEWLTGYDLHKLWTQARPERYPWTGRLASHVGYRAIDDFAAALRAFAGRRKDGSVRKTRAGFPRWKRHGADESFRANNSRTGVKVAGRRLKIPKLPPSEEVDPATGRRRPGWIRMREELRWEGEIVGCVVSRTAGRWHASITVETADELPVPAAAGGGAIGVRLGLETLARCSDGHSYPAPRSLARSLRELASLQRRMARQEGPYDQRSGERRAPSRGWLRSKLELQRLHARIAARRADAIHKATDAIARRAEREGARVAVQDLNIAGMLQCRTVARSISDAAWGEFGRQLEYKCALRGVPFDRVSAWYPAAKLCHECGHVHDVLAWGEGEWACPECGLVHERGYNAARNIAAAAAAAAAAATGAGSALDRVEGPPQPGEARTSTNGAGAAAPAPRGDAARQARRDAPVAGSPE